MKYIASCSFGKESKEEVMEEFTRCGYSEKIYCCVCGRQVTERGTHYSEYEGPLEGSKANIGRSLFCGTCAEDLDENGLFPEEGRQCNA
jgi:hypothetical protein